MSLLVAILAGEHEPDTGEEPLPALLERVFAAGMSGDRSVPEAALSTARRMIEDARGEGALLGYAAALLEAAEA